MKRPLMTRVTKALPILLMLASCGATCGDGLEPAVTRPLAQAYVTGAMSYDQVSEVVMAYSRINNFNVQELLSHPQGNMEFLIRLSRDDISVTVSKMVGDPIFLAASPLCVGEAGNRVELQAAAEATVRELQQEISR